MKNYTLITGVCKRSGKFNRLQQAIIGASAASPYLVMSTSTLSVRMYVALTMYICH